MTRPDNPTPQCYRPLPIGYNSRASTGRPSHEPTRRPNVQWRRPDGSIYFGPTESLDDELEIGVFISPGNARGMPLTMACVLDQLFGYCLLNDGSARDLQRWESTLGPFLSKAFAASISPWIITADALAPFVRPNTRPAGDPKPLPYLDSAADRAGGLLDIDNAAPNRSCCQREKAALGWSTTTT